MLQQPSTPEPNGQSTSTKSETNNLAVHAGLSDQLKLSQTDSLLPQTELLTSSSHLKIWLLAILETTDAKEVTSTKPGNISKTLVLLPTLAITTNQLQVLHQSAQPSVMMVQLKLATDTSANQALLLTQQLLQPSKLKSTPTDPLKVDSQSTKTSTTTRVESTTTQVDNSSEVTPSRFLVGDLNQDITTGSALTHGENHGENKDTSRSSKETAELTTKSTPAPQTPLDQRPSSEDTEFNLNPSLISYLIIS